MPEFFWKNIARHHDQAQPDHAGQRRRRFWPGQRRVGLGRDHAGRRAVRRARPERGHRRLPGPEHRLRVRGRLLHRGQPEHGRHACRPAGASRRPMIQASVNSGVESPTYAATFDEAFLELAAQGQSAFVSAGDFGAYTAVRGPRARRTCPRATRTAARGSPRRAAPRCPATSRSPRPTRPPSPPSGPGAGTGCGRSSPSSPTRRRTPRTSEEAFAKANALGGGGGFSVLEPTPVYQQLVPSAHAFSADAST